MSRDIRQVLVLVLALAVSVVSARPADFLMSDKARDPAQYVRDGIDTYVAGGDISKIALFTASELGVSVTNDDSRAEIERNRKILAREGERAMKAGLSLCVGTDEAKYPVDVWNHLKRVAPDPNQRGRVDFASEKFWEFHRAKYREIMRTLPSCVQYVMVRTGENYPDAVKGFSGQTVAVRGRRGPETAYARDMARFINETRRVVVDEFGKTLIWRTWDLGNEGFHADTNVYARVMAGVTNRVGLIMAIKFVQTDYWSYNDFNPCIELDAAKKLIEFQSCREYEGKSVYPNWVGRLHGAALKRLATNPCIVGSWLWGDHAGGSGGPFSQTDVWQRLNYETSLTLIRHPEWEPDQVLRDWCAARFGTAAADTVAAALSRSHETVEKMLYVGVFACAHKGWKPHLNITRDDSIGGGKNHEMDTIYGEVKDRLVDVFREKDEAVAEARAMRERFESARAAIVSAKGEDCYQTSLTGFIYLERLAQVFQTYIKGYFLFCRWRDDRTEFNLQAARTAIAEWRAAWESYQREIPRLPAAPTPYQSRHDSRTPDGGMADVMEKAAAEIK